MRAELREEKGREEGWSLESEEKKVPPGGMGPKGVRESARGNGENEAASEVLEYEAARFSQQRILMENGGFSRPLVASRGKPGGYARRNDDGGYELWMSETRETEFHGLRCLLLFARLHWWAMNHERLAYAWERKKPLIETANSKYKNRYFRQRQCNSYD